MPGSEIDAVLAAGVTGGAVTGVCAAAWSERGRYQGAAGEAATGVPMRPDTVLRIFSMTKALTAAAAMQLVERGQVGLDDPAGAVVEYLAGVQVLDGFDADGTPRLRPPTRPVTLRNLLSHTSGFGYDFADESLARFLPTLGPSPANTQAGYEHPLTSDPGTRWAYGIGIDWAGRVVEAVSGQSLEDYLAEHLIGPLGMVDTSFRPTADQIDRLANLSLRTRKGWSRWSTSRRTTVHRWRWRPAAAVSTPRSSTTCASPG